LLSSYCRGNRGLGVTPICNFGDVAILRTTRITKNDGKQFWGCHNYKVRFMQFCFVKFCFWDNFLITITCYMLWFCWRT